MLEQILGHERPKRIIQKLSPPQTPLLLYGPKGSGKSFFAQQLCLHYSQNHEEDIHHYLPENKSQTHSAQTSRELIAQAKIPPYRAPYRTFFIEQAHRMLPSASNTLLKTLEEPLPTSLFFLTTSHPQHMLTTITSRTHAIAFDPLPHSIILSLFPNTSLHFGSLHWAEKHHHNPVAPWTQQLLDLLNNHAPLPYYQNLIEQVDDLELFFTIITTHIQDLHRIQHNIPTTTTTPPSSPHTNFLPSYPQLTQALLKAHRSLELFLTPQAICQQFLTDLFLDALSPNRRV